MEENQFYKFVWRFNAIVLMVAGILAIGVLLFSGYHILQDITRERDTRNIVNVSEDQPIDEKWELGRLYKIEGTSYIMVPLTSDQSYAQSYYSKSSNSVRNYLFIDTQNNHQEWLFETNENLVADIDFLSEKNYNDKALKVRAILYTVVDKDTNKDKRLTNKDETTIAVSLPNGLGYKEILKGIDFLVGHQVLDEKSMLLVYQKGGIGYTANLSFIDLSISNETQIPPITANP